VNRNFVENKACRRVNKKLSKIRYKCDKVANRALRLCHKTRRRGRNKCYKNARRNKDMCIKARQRSMRLCKQTFKKAKRVLRVATKLALRNAKKAQPQFREQSNQRAENRFQQTAAAQILADTRTVTNGTKVAPQDRAAAKGKVLLANLWACKKKVYLQRNVCHRIRNGTLRRCLKPFDPYTIVVGTMKEHGRRRTTPSVTTPATAPQSVGTRVSPASGGGRESGGGSPAAATNKLVKGITNKLMKGIVHTHSSVTPLSTTASTKDLNASARSTVTAACIWPCGSAKDEAEVKKYLSEKGTRAKYLKDAPRR